MVTLLVVALFVPLFPLSVVLNGLLASLRDPAARAALVLVWPQLGVALLQFVPQPVPQFLLPWALATAALYALRLLTVRDLGQWAGFLATSALALTWALSTATADRAALHAFAFWFSLPPALMLLLAGALARRFGAAYAGLPGGLLSRMPRLSALFALTVLAAVATPPFPGFFALLRLLLALDWHAAAGVLALWLVWGWAATRLLQGFIFGAARDVPHGDLGPATTASVVGALGAFAIAGIVLSGGGL